MTAYVDFRFASTGDLANLGGSASRFNHNFTAIKLLKSLEEEGRAHGDLAPEEQRTLARYSGWGDGEVLNRLFPYGAYPQAPIRPELDGILTIEERGKIAGSALNAHYTALPIIGAIYEALYYLGIGALDSLRVLEPAAGIGHFFGAMPAEIAAKAERVAVELDSITARILQYLYPNAKVFNQGFEETRLPNDYFDLILGNPPYGAYAVHDPLIKQRHLKAAIHDYFFARSLRLLKPGGIIAFITSRYTLDKVDSRVRRHIAERADLLAAARLPESAFRKNAGTEVVADVLILRKKFKSGGVDEKTGWLETDVFPNEMDYRVPVNLLYIERSDLMLGVPGCSHGMYSDCEFTLKPDGRHLASLLRDSLISQLPYQAITAVASQPAMLSPSLIEDAQEKEKANAANLDRPSGTSRQRASLLLDIYAAAKQVIRLQLIDAGDEKLTSAQRELNDIYFRFTTRYGRINAKQNLKDLDRRSPIVPFLKALEEPAGKGAWRRAAIFHSRTIRPHKNFTHISSPKDALFFCLNECGRVDLDRIAALTGQTRHEVANALRGLIFETPSGGWVTADEYLSGNVVAKLKEAQSAAALDSRFQENVEALKAVQPAPLGPEEIAARLGAGWIPPEVVCDFIREIIPQFDGGVKYIEHLGVWKIEGADILARRSIEATQTWGTARMNAIDLVECALNLHQPMIYDEVDEPAGKRRVLNDTETVAAQAKLAEIKTEFVKWIWSDEERARELCAVYNERYNCLRERRYDGSHLQLPGMNSSITLRSHQLDGVARVLQSRATLLGHCVGSGKTFLMVAAAMELKRLGLCHKAMAVVPNHLPAQWEAEARRLYPGINALAPSKEELSASQRGELLSRIATGRWDLVILPHTAFKMLPVAQETIARYIQREIDALREYIENIPKDERNDHRRTIKEIERSIKKLEVKLKDCESAILRDSKHTITWEELGVDLIMADECHLYKNLYCPTKMRNVAGLPTADSQRAFDAFIKVRSLLDNGGRVVFATATPVSNTLAEVYVMMKFLQLEMLEEMSIANFDAWVQLFAEISQGLEMKPDASGFRLVSRFNKFTNLPELAALWRQALDVKNADQINLPRPRIAGGAPQVITIPASPEIKQFIKKLAARVDAIKSRRVSPDVDNMLRITTEGRKAALDIRLVMPDAPPPAYSKIDALADKVLEFYRLSQKDRGAQVVFCDLINCRPLA
ncbi:MAG: Eco57I restriction-modification methylase domain-containing protein [Blastocatellia bacterium]